LCGLQPSSYTVPVSDNILKLKKDDALRGLTMKPIEEEPLHL